MNNSTGHFLPLDPDDTQNLNQISSCINEANIIVIEKSYNEIDNDIILDIAMKIKNIKKDRKNYNTVINIFNKQIFY